MNETEEKYLRASLNLLAEYLDVSAETMLAEYQRQSREGEVCDWMIETDQNDLVYCVFSRPLHSCERVILLVYDHLMRVMADFSALHCSGEDLLYSRDFYDLVSTESDWMYLEHYVLCGSVFPQVSYPGCEMAEQKISVDAEAVLCASAYVTRAYRQRGIFSTMLQIIREFSLRHRKGAVCLYTVFSLDPDIACYGPDADDQPYYYSFEKDEPVRMLNRMILEKMGYEVIRLQETEPEPGSDGTKLWFALRAENDVIIDLETSV